MKLRAVMLGSDLLALGAKPNEWTDELTVFDARLRRWRCWFPVARGIVYKEDRRW